MKRNQRKSNRKRGEFSSFFRITPEIHKGYDCQQPVVTYLCIRSAAVDQINKKKKKQVDKLQVQTLCCQIPCFKKCGSRINYFHRISQFFYDLYLQNTIPIIIFCTGYTVQNITKYSWHVNKREIIQIQIIWLSSDCGSDFITSTFKSFFKLCIFFFFYVLSCFSPPIFQVPHTICIYSLGVQYVKLYV